MRRSFNSDSLVTARRSGARAGIAIGAAVAFLGALGYALWPSEPDLAPLESLNVKFTIGAQADYDLELDSTVTLGVHNADATSSRAPVRQTLTGTLALAATSSAAAGVLARMQLANVHYALDGQRQSAVERDLSTPFTVVWTTGGSPAQFRFAASTTPSVAGILEETVRTFQCVVPPGSMRSWTSNETHASGTYRADYRQASTSSTCTRIRVEYSAPGSSDVGLNRSRVIGSQATFTLAEDLWLTTAQVDDHWISTGTGQVMARCHTRGSLRRRSDHSLAASLVHQSHSRPSQTMVTRSDLDQVQSRKPIVVSTEPTPESRAEFRAALETLDRSGGEDVQAMLALRDLMQKFPGLADQIPGLVRANRLADRATAALLHAAELAGNPRAQTALVTVAEDQLVAHRHRLRAIVALGGVEAPTQLATQWLQQQSATLAATEEQLDRVHTALLSLGRCGAAMKQAEPQRYQAEVQSILAERLARSPRPEHAAIALKAIGNTADATLTNTVVDRLRSNSAAERSAAAEALGSMNATSARESLLGHLDTEASGRVRQHVVKALAHVAPKDPQILQTLDARISKEPDGEARFAMARYLVEGLDTRPQSRQSLERLLQTETEPQIVRYVAGRLYRRAKD